jgi:arabinofuranan 3-O-arabinosyltransferase
MKRPLHRAMLALVVALAAAGLLVMLSQPRAARLSSDFTINYSAGVLVREGHLAAPYHQAELGEMMRRVARDGAIDPRLPFSLPLIAALPFAVLSLVPIDIAFGVWQLVGAALLLLSVLILQRARPLDRTAPGFAVLGLLAAVPTWTALTEGQVTPLLVVGGAIMIAALGRDRWAQAALAGALLAVKPQYLPAYLVVLVAARHWRSLVAAGAAAAVVLMSPLAGGVGGMTAMIHNALRANQAVAIRLDEAWIGVLGPALPAAAAPAVAIVVYVVVLATLGVIAWRRPASLIGFATVAIILCVLASPHALPHDLLMLAVPAWLAVVLFREGRVPNPVAGVLLVDLALLIDLHGVGLPLGPIVITAVVGWYGWQFRQRARQQRRPPVVLAA